MPDPWPRVPDYVPDQPAPPMDGATPTAEVIAPAAPAAVAREAPATAPPPQEVTPQPERERVVVAGRVGRPPVFGATPKGQPKLTFQLGEHPDPEHTVWHRVVAFGDRAVTLHSWLTAGELVEVVGYRHVNEYRGKTTEEIYASNVRSLRTGAPPSAPKTKR